MGEPIRYLSGEEVVGGFPPVVVRLALADRTMIALLTVAVLTP
jgi:hypothetical protein